MDLIKVLIALLPMTFAFPLKPLPSLSSSSVDHLDHPQPQWPLTISTDQGISGSVSSHPDQPTSTARTTKIGSKEAHGRPSFDPRLISNPELFEGDILAPNTDDWRNAVRWEFQIWPQGVIPYVIDASLNDIKEHIDVALSHIQNRTCIRFKKRTTEVDYIKYYAGKGCYSHVGRQGDAQTISIGRGCDFHGLIVHETMHAIGFHHMHTRTDRDQYLDIFWENIAQDFKSQFIAQSAEEMRLLTPFDYDSIMMYGSTTGSEDGKSITMLPVNKTITLIDAADKPGLSGYDIVAISELYKCNGQ